MDDYADHGCADIPFDETDDCGEEKIGKRMTIHSLGSALQTKASMSKENSHAKVAYTQSLNVQNISLKKFSASS
jgi:hypothetical protein